MEGVEWGYHRSVAALRRYPPAAVAICRPDETWGHRQKAAVRVFPRLSALLWT